MATDNKTKRLQFWGFIFCLVVWSAFAIYLISGEHNTFTSSPSYQECAVGTTLQADGSCMSQE